MTSTSYQQANPGVYRGVVVDNKDPQGLGRIRVSVPRIMGASATGWALPAWSLHDWTIWPEDRIPTTNQGVWVIFEGPDKITWIATYGAQEFSKQSLDDPITSGDDEGNLYTYQTFITWEFSVLPQDIPITITGTLTSKSGTPQPTPIVVFQKSTNSNGPWQDTPSYARVNDDGTWSLTYTRLGTEQNYWYRAFYAGADPFWPVATTPAQVKDTATSISWTPPPASPPSQYWKTPVAITGALLDHNNAGLTGKPVVIRISSNQTTWTDLATVTTTTNGVFSYQYTRTDINPVYMRIHFLGDLTKDSSVSPSIGTFATVLVPTSITWTFPTLTFNTLATITGAITTASYGTPVPSTMQFWQEVGPNSGNWSVIRNVTPAADGTFSTTVQQTAPDVQYTMVYEGSAPFQYSESTYVTRSVASTTTTTAPTLPATLTHGIGFTATGNVKDSLNRPATTGSCKLWYRFANGPDTTWKPTSANAVTPNASGNYTISHPALTVVGPLDWKVVYTGAGAFLSSESTSVSKSIGLAAVTGLAKDPNWLNLSTGGTYWNAVSGATYYEVLLTGVNWYYPTATSISVGGLASYTTYTYQVGAIKQDAAGNWVYGGTASATFNTGRSEQRNINGFTDWHYAASTRSWRTGSDGGWGPWGSFGSDWVFQGTYSGQNYDGVMTYDGGAFQNDIRNNFGQNTLDYIRGNNGIWTKCWLWLTRISGTGYTTGNMDLRFNVSSARAGITTGPHNYAGGDAAHTLGNGAGGWHGLVPHWAGHVLLNEDVGHGPCYSFMLEWDGTTHYLRCYGASSGWPHAHLEISGNWNYQTVSPITPYWF